MVIDCPDPAALAVFYAELIGLPVTHHTDDWVVISANETTSGFAFQRAADYQPPQWPDPARPQQFHLEVMVDEISAAETQVLALELSTNDAILAITRREAAVAATKAPPNSTLRSAAGFPERCGVTKHWDFGPGSG